MDSWVNKRKPWPPTWTIIESLGTISNLHLSRVINEGNANLRYSPVIPNMIILEMEFWGPRQGHREIILSSIEKCCRGPLIGCQISVLPLASTTPEGVSSNNMLAFFASCYDTLSMALR